MGAYYDDGRGRYGTGESYDYFWQYAEDENVRIATSEDGLWTYAMKTDDEAEDGIELVRYNGDQTEIAVPGRVDGRTVTALRCTFDGFYELKRVSVPEGITLIEGAFYGCEGLESITLPDSLEEMSYGLNCCYSLKEVKIPPHVRDFSWAFEGTELKTIVFPPGTEDISHAFMGSSVLRSAVVPGSVTDMEEAFADCEALTDVVLEDGLREIGDYAFYHCTALRELTIPESVTVFGTLAVGFMELREYTDSRKMAYRIRGNAVIPGFRIRGRAGSQAERYAQENGISFTPIRE